MPPKIQRRNAISNMGLLGGIRIVYSKNVFQLVGHRKMEKVIDVEQSFRKFKYRGSLDFSNTTHKQITAYLLREKYLLYDQEEVGTFIKFGGISLVEK